MLSGRKVAIKLIDWQIDWLLESLDKTHQNTHQADKLRRIGNRYGMCRPNIRTAMQISVYILSVETLKVENKKTSCCRTRLT